MFTLTSQRHLKVDSKQRHVLVILDTSTPFQCFSPSSPSLNDAAQAQEPMRQILTRVLFEHFRVPSLAFVPPSLMALLATGRITGLVVHLSGGGNAWGCSSDLPEPDLERAEGADGEGEAGRSAETSVTPVYYGRIVETARKATTRAGSTVRARLRALLLRYGRVCYRRSTASSAPRADASEAPASMPASSAASSASALERVITRVPAALLTPKVIDELLARICFVGQLDPYAHERADGSSSSQSKSQSLLERQHALYASSSKAKAMSVPIASLLDSDPQAQGPASPANPPEAPLTSRAAGSTLSSTPITSATRSAPRASPPRPSSSSSPDDLLDDLVNDPAAVLVVPGWVRERTTEVLFEPEDDLDEPSIITAVLDSLLALPIDLRKPLASQILLGGGGLAMLPNMAHRIAQELSFRLQHGPVPGRALSFSAHQGHASVPSSPGPSPAALRAKRDKYASLRGLVGTIAVLNDHAPTLSLLPPPSDGARPSSAPTYELAPPAQSSGSATVFPTSMYAFVGASIVGALQTTSLSELKRDAWDAQQRLLLLSQQQHQQPESTAADASSAATRRPALAGRGSFVGVVNGLETGAFGALSAVSRHITSPTSETPSGGGGRGLGLPRASSHGSPS